MNTFLAVLSFPFWFAGAVLVLACLFGSVKFNKREVRGIKRAPVFLIGCLFLFLAYAMI